MTIRRAVTMIDGKPVLCWLIACVRAGVSGKRDVFLYQVQAFTKDHAIKRLRELAPDVPRNAWTVIEELDPEHDVGKMGVFLPLLPNGSTPIASRNYRVQ